MGVPSLYRWLTQRYPSIKRPVSEKSPQAADCLYLDFNAIIHPCCNKGFDNMEDTETQLHANIISYVNKLMGIVRPRRLLYVSIDGVAPRAKLNQQRSRRFVKAKESMECGEVYFKDESNGMCCGAEPGAQHEDTEDEALRREAFDSNAITPGTRFMDRLDLFLREMIQAKISEDPLWKSINVIYTGYRTPGEGEQKIMEYIRKHQRTSLRHVIYSPDADLIFLGLTLFDYNIFIMREEPRRVYGSEKDESTAPSVIVSNSYDDKDFVFVDVQRLRGSLTGDFKAVLKADFDSRRFLTDWIFMCFAMGNDFVPSAPCFEIKTNAIDKITAIMLELFRKTGRYITDGRDINFDVLKQFFVLCSAREDDFLVEKSRNLFLSRSRMRLPYDPQEEFPLNTERGKIRFYMEKMGIRSERELLEACKEYIKGFAWIYSYYFYEVSSWDWFYPHHFAPFMMDLARVSNLRLSFSLGRPLRPMEQLLAVLPAHSRGLLPESLWGVFEENEEMYPTDFKIDTFQKCMEWQAIPILPFMDISRIRRSYGARQAALTYEEVDRNVVAYPLLYTKQPQAVLKAAELYSRAERPFEVLSCDEFSGKVFPVPVVDGVGAKVERLGFAYTNQAAVFSFDQRCARPRGRR